MKEQSIALISPFDNKGNVLLLKRDENQYCKGLWSFPGGKIMIGETPKIAAARELKEETGLNGSAWALIGEHRHAYPDRKLHFFLFSCLCKESNTLIAESTHIWVDGEHIANYPMPAANRELISMLHTWMKQR
ncbi:MAG: NUDIX domain-containing protein [Mariprofundaceae bacterium]